MFGFHGLQAYAEDGEVLKAPLRRARIEAAVHDLTATVRVEQDFINSFKRDDAEFVYSLPVPDRATVTAFSLARQDGTAVVAVVQEKAEASKTYEEAVKAGKLAGLASETTPDVFKLTIGRLPVGESVKAKLTYAIELTDDEDFDSVRLYIPVALGQRVFFSMSAPIATIGSSSHTVQTALGSDDSSRPAGQDASLTFEATDPLKKDFVANVKCRGLDTPRALAEVSPADGTVAYSITMVPKFSLPDLEQQEFIFLVDRSGSMGVSGANLWGGSQQGGKTRIELARNALVVMLRSLPHKDTTFNLWSFGNESASLWPESRPYNQSTLDQATKYVDSMQADMGGTELAAALKSIFDKRSKDRRTALFVLTDGETWDLEGTLELVRGTVSKASDDNLLRVYTLGIGSSASTAMVNGVARCGQGVSTFVSDGESFTKKTARLLKAARSQPIRDVKIDYGVATEHGSADDDFEMVDKEEPAKASEKSSGEGTLSMYDESVDVLESGDRGVPAAAPVNLPPFELVQQAPRRITALAPANRVHAYALVRSKKAAPMLKMTGVALNGQKLALDIPVTSSESQGKNEVPSLHATSAKRLVQSYQEGEHSFTTTDKDLQERTVKAAILRLGKAYSIATSETTFVAVDEREVDKQKSGLAYMKQPRYGYGASTFAMTRAAAPGGQRFARMAGGGPGPAPAASPFGSSSAWGGAVPPPPAAAPAAPMVMMNVAPPQSGPRLFGGGPISKKAKNATTTGFDGSGEEKDEEAAVSTADPLSELARLQAFDGSFSADIVGFVSNQAALDTIAAVVSAKDVQHTMLALAYLKYGPLKGQEEEWEDMAGKARQFVLDSGETKGEEALDKVLQSAGSHISS